jgi:IS605 OrfB family transposase
MAMKTFKFRIKDSSKKVGLKAQASKVNFVWNYCNEISEKAWKADRKWLSNYDLNYLTSGSSKELKLSSASIQMICKEFTIRRNKVKKSKLKWRSYKKNLGWIPVRGDLLTIQNDSVIFQKKTYKIWKHRPLQGQIKTANFSQNSKGQWFINIVCEIENVENPSTTTSSEVVGIDLGLKTLATLSNGEKIENPKILQRFVNKLATAQRAGKKKQVTNIHNKIKNVRKDFLHKEAAKLVKRFDIIIVGDVSSKKLSKTKFAKSIYDASWATFKTLLEEKAISLSKSFQTVNEKFSTVTCCACSERTGPSGLSNLGVRSWTCSSCNVSHDRDTNAAKNIMNFGLGHETPIKGSPSL